MHRLPSKILIFFLIILFSGCGFEILDKSSLNNFNIKEINSTGDKRINFKIKNNLLVDVERNSQILISLDLDTKKIKSIKEKNIKNEVARYQIVLKSIVKVSMQNKEDIYVFDTSVSGDYNVVDQYASTLNNEKKLIEKLIGQISDKILNEIAFKLNDI